MIGPDLHSLLVQNVVTCSRVVDEFRAIRLWYNRENKNPTIPEELAPYLRGKHFLSTKQAPSALSLRKAGSASVSREQSSLNQSGIRTDVTTTETNPLSHLVTPSQSYKTESGSLPPSFGPSVSEENYSFDYENPGEVEPLTEDISEHLQGDDPEKLTRPKRKLVRVKYEDPWKIHAALVLSDVCGVRKPQVLSWNGDGLRIQDMLSPYLFGSAIESQMKNKIHFWDLKDHAAKAFFLRNHTHWGYALYEYARDKECDYHSFAVNLKRRILRLLSGKSDPCMPESTRTEVFVNPDEVRDTKQRSIRFVELLKTVDGIFLQRYLTYPEEVWNWSKFDLFILQGISHLIGDEFLDGELTQFGLTIVTSYSSLKKIRKSFKKASLRGDLKDYAHEYHKGSHWTKPYFDDLYNRAARQTGSRQIFTVGLISQTRGAGRPPPLVSLQSKRDFLAIITAEPPKGTQTKRTLVKAALDQILRDLPQEAFTGLATKARVTVATSASWEKTRKEGGTVEAIREVLGTYSADDPVPVRDLTTGKIIDYIAPTAFESIGEFVFWASLDHILRTPHEYLRFIFLTVVQEPGKARTVTKGSACLKIVLDVVNKICSWPLKKGIESSNSGMGRSHHAWNYFIRMMSDEMKHDLFHVSERQEEPYEGYIERTDEYSDFFLSSTDYKEATDAMLHEFAQMSGNAWMLKCGIPPVLRGVVNMACYGPRTVVFTGTGGLSGIGRPSPLGENLREVTMVRGIPMGDPLTKIVLHMSNIVTRSIGSGLLSGSSYQTSVNSHEAAEAFRNGLTGR